jgi:hypothetical protein
MLEKHVWRDFAAVTFSVAVLGLGLGSTLPLTALVLNARNRRSVIAPLLILGEAWLTSSPA